MTAIWVSIRPLRVEVCLSQSTPAKCLLYSRKKWVKFPEALDTHKENARLGNRPGVFWHQTIRTLSEWLVK
jgi:hypothetical protein